MDLAHFDEKGRHFSPLSRDQWSALWAAEQQLAHSHNPDASFFDIAAQTMATAMRYVNGTTPSMHQITVWHNPPRSLGDYLSNEWHALNDVDTFAEIDRAMAQSENPISSAGWAILGAAYVVPRVVGDVGYSAGNGMVQGAMGRVDMVEALRHLPEAAIVAPIDRVREGLAQIESGQLTFGLYGALRGTVELTPAISGGASLVKSLGSTVVNGAKTIGQDLANSVSQSTLTHSLSPALAIAPARVGTMAWEMDANPAWRLMAAPMLRDDGESSSAHMMSPDIHIGARPRPLEPIGAMLKQSWDELGGVARDLPTMFRELGLHNPLPLMEGVWVAGRAMIHPTLLTATAYNVFASFYRTATNSDKTNPPISDLIVDLVPGLKPYVDFLEPAIGVASFGLIGGYTNALAGWAWRWSSYTIFSSLWGVGSMAIMDASSGTGFYHAHWPYLLRGSFLDTLFFGGLPNVLNKVKEKCKVVPWEKVVAAAEQRWGRLGRLLKKIPKSIVPEEILTLKGSLVFVGAANVFQTGGAVVSAFFNGKNPVEEFYAATLRLWTVDNGFKLIELFGRPFTNGWHATVLAGGQIGENIWTAGQYSIYSGLGLYREILQDMAADGDSCHDLMGKLMQSLGTTRASYGSPQSLDPIEWKNLVVDMVSGRFSSVSLQNHQVNYSNPVAEYLATCATRGIPSELEHKRAMVATLAALRLYSNHHHDDHFLEWEPHLPEGTALNAEEFESALAIEKRLRRQLSESLSGLPVPIAQTYPEFKEIIEAINEGRYDRFFEDAVLVPVSSIPFKDHATPFFSSK